MRTGLAAWIAAAALAGSAARAEEAQGSPKPKRKLLVYTLSAGFKHDCIPTMATALVKRGEESGAYAATVSNDPEAFTDENLKTYDAVFFYTTGNVLPKPEQRKALFNFVKGGKGFVGSHCATDTLYDDKDGCPEYGKMIGAYFDGHPWNAGSKAVLKIDDASHPATRGLPAAWNVVDEIYRFRSFSRDRVRVLLSLDANLMDVTRGKRADKDYAIAWCREYGKGRVFYTALGHMKGLWQDETFLDKHVLPAIRWAMGDAAWEMPAGPGKAGLAGSDHLLYFGYFGNKFDETAAHTNLIMDVGDVDGDVPKFEAQGFKYVLNIWWFGDKDRDSRLNGASWDAWVKKIGPHISSIAAFNLADEPAPAPGLTAFFERQIQKLKSQFPGIPTLIEYDHAFDVLPSGLDWLLLEYYGFTAKAAKQHFDKEIRPQMNPSQRILLAPSGDTDDFGVGTDGENARNAADFFEWAKADSVVVGIVPWFWDSWGPHGVKNLPVTRAKYLEIGKAITDKDGATK